MKTTLEERRDHKFARRFQGLQRLVKDIDARCEVSDKTLVEVEKVLRKVADSGLVEQYVDVIRRAN